MDNLKIGPSVPEMVPLMLTQTKTCSIDQTFEPKYDTGYELLDEQQQYKMTSSSD